ncbi:hypothetical protein F6W69_18680 [Microbacterium oxydans]|uniref:hypothetical protein n=1 Tax=Microbacterium oxydans TaxID=82380 RepID=UPI0011413B82|nr:hypothetical protein [Microbacterium oxydans]KAB1888781.1 hypothetical protein F6W69_18680 [Microbacterium oxydans]GED40596.1 hypothetical protein MOX01_37380 [Microbacterium oxydans]
MEISWNDVQYRDLVRFTWTLPNGEQIPVESFIMPESKDDPDFTHILENSPQWMGDFARPTDGTVELLDRPQPNGVRTPSGWQGNVEDAFWGVIVSPGRQHFYEGGRSVCGTVPFFNGPGFARQLPAFRPCEDCEAIVNSRDQSFLETVRIVARATQWVGGWELWIAGMVQTQVGSLERAEQQVRDWLDTDDPDTDHSDWVVTVIADGAA